MNRLSYLMELCCISGIVSIVVRFLGGLELSYVILLVLLTIDTTTGMATAVKYNRFSSRGLSKFIKKVITYTVCIITVRLLEIGVLTLVETTMLSQIMLAVLEVTETVSILENLALLGVPIPSNFVAFLLQHLKIPGLDKVISQNQNRSRELSEIEDIIKYQIPSFDNENIRSMLEINFKIWKKTAQQIDHILREKDNDNYELIYYKMMAQIELAVKERDDEWKREGIARLYIDKFHMCNDNKMDRLVQTMKCICFNEESIECKKEKLIEAIIAMLYQTILDGHRCMS